MNELGVKTNVQIKFNGVSKKFSQTISSLRSNGIKDLTRILFGLSPDDKILRKGEFWALKNVNFDINPGESVALLGLNGSGKSTILKLVNNLIQPDIGNVFTAGHVEALIELGTGFHPMLTGRQNIYIKCSMNGLSDTQIDNIFEDIVDFAELWDFIDLPVKNYSSGMYARLGFATAVFGKPDILLVDEVLSVGDFRFKQKCLEKISEIKKRTSILFVSHSLQTVRMFCDRGIVMEKGEVVFDGSSVEATEFYTKRYENNNNLITDSGNRFISNKNEVYGDLFWNKSKVLEVNTFWSDEFGENTNVFSRDKSLVFNFAFKLTKEVDNLIIGIPIWNSKDELITALNSDLQLHKIKPDSSGLVKGKIVVKNVFNKGDYTPIFAIVSGVEYLYRQIATEFKVSSLNVREIGAFTPEQTWEFTECHI